jgi:signal peptidase I
MTRPPHLRSWLLSATLVVLAVAAWLVLAPTQIGGETSYVTTSGISMAPRFHTGDLAVVRPTKHYKVGDIVAYRSTMLHTVVLHRIVAVKGDRYVFKGDNNNFVDPTRPARGDLVGRLSLRVAHGGRVLAWLHTPFMAALLMGGLAALLLLGAKHQRRRRDRRRPSEAPAGHARPRPAADREAILGVGRQTLFTASAVAAAAFLALSALAFGHPASKPIAVKTPYTEKVSFGYHAKAPAGPVYPDGIVKTGDPIFLKLVRRVRVKAHYRLAAAAPQRLGGTMEVLLRISSPTGWSRTIQLAAPKHFTGDYASADVMLDVPALQSLIRKVERLTGGTPGAAYNLWITPRVHVTGTLASQPLTSDYAPALALKLDSLQLRGAPAAAADPAADPDPGSGPTPEQKAAFNPSRGGNVAASSTATNALGLRGHDVPVPTIRWIALIGFLLAASAALLTGVRLLGESTDPAAHIHRYRHLIVPIAGTTFDPARPPIDVTSIAALAQLAERSERLLLHHQRDGVDTYLVDDEGTLYRYQAHSHLRQIPALSVVDGTLYEAAAR